MPQFEIFKIVPARCQETFHIGKISKQKSTLMQYFYACKLKATFTLKKNVSSTLFENVFMIFSNR